MMVEPPDGTRYVKNESHSLSSRGARPVDDLYANSSIELKTDGAAKPSSEGLLDHAVRNMVKIDHEIGRLKEEREIMERQARQAIQDLQQKFQIANDLYRMDNPSGGSWLPENG